MFFVFPVYMILIIYVLAAIIPAFFLMRYVYRQDHIEKESPILLIQLIFCGIAAALVAGLFEYIGEIILNTATNEKISNDSPTYTILLAFLVVGAVEEGTKLLFLYLRSWNAPDFNYRFDGIVYAVFTGLGFAAFENIKYVMGYGLTVAIPRALLAIPGHMSFAVFMGVFYGRARLSADLGNNAGKCLNIFMGYIIAVILHGIYDSCAMIGTTLATIIFILFVAVMYLIVFRIIKRESANDRPV